MIVHPIRGHGILLGGNTASGPSNETWTIGDRNVPTPVSFGAGCSWGQGTPSLTATDPSWRGEFTDLVVTGLPTAPSQAPFLYLGLRAATPIDLTPFGAPGCSFLLDTAAPTTFFAGQNNNGTARWSFPIPNTAIGTQFAFQVLALAPSANALGAVTSNGLESKVR